MEGTIQVRRSGELVAEISAGSHDAQFSLNQLRAREATAYAPEAASLLRLDMSLVSTLLLWAHSAAAAGLTPATPATHRAQAGDAASLEWLPKLLTSELFSSIPAANLHRVFEVMEPVSAPAGETVVRQGEPGVYYYVIRQGHFEVTRTPSDVDQPYRLAELGPGDSFGEEALVSESRRNATVTAHTEGELLRLTKEDFVTLIIHPSLQFVDRARDATMADEGAVWLDVRLPEEHRNDGLPESLNIPLHQLRARSDELSREGRYILYCNAGRRSAAACTAMRSWGFNAFVLDGGLLADPDPEATELSDRDSGEEGAGHQLQGELARADAELEAALRLKVEATAARRIFADTATQVSTQQKATDKEKSRLRAKLKRLELESHAAGQALSHAQRKRLEVEAALRAEAANAEKARAETAAQIDELHAGAEEKLQAEQERITNTYTKSEARITELADQRRTAEVNFENERARMQAEFSARLETIEKEAATLRAGMSRAKEDGAKRAAAIREEQDAAVEDARVQTESGLQRERERLESEFAAATVQIDNAKQRMEHLRTRREEADSEARDFAMALRQAAQERREAAEALWEAEQARLHDEVDSASTRADEARATKDTAETQRQALYAELERLRSKKDQPREANPSTPDEPIAPAAPPALGETTLSLNLAEQEAKIAAAQGAMEQAEEDHRAAQTAAATAHAREAEESAAEQELRLRLYSEAEEWLQEEGARTQYDLESAEVQVQAMKRARFESDARRLNQHTQDISMISDIQAQLGAAGSPVRLPGRSATRRRPNNGRRR